MGHLEGSTIITVAVMLNNESDYKGGQFIFRRLYPAKHKEVYQNLSRGTALAWRGSHTHAVLPVSEGESGVFVMEFWPGDDCANSTSDDMRLKENIDTLRQGAHLDPDSWDLHYELGQALCKRLPCNSTLVAEEAESAYRRALLIRSHVIKKSWGKDLLLNLVTYMGSFKWCIWSEELNEGEYILQVNDHTLKAWAKQNLIWIIASLCVILIAIFLKVWKS